MAMAMAYVLTVSDMFSTLLVVTLCLSSSPTATPANKYRQLNGSSVDDDADDGNGETCE